jgi:hypothetical protein
MILDATSSLSLPPPAPSIWLFRAILAILSWEVCDHFASIQEFRLEKNSNTHTHTHTYTHTHTHTHTHEEHGSLPISPEAFCSLPAVFRDSKDNNNLL